MLGKLLKCGCFWRSTSPEALQHGRRAAQHLDSLCADYALQLGDIAVAHRTVYSCNSMDG